MTISLDTSIKYLCSDCAPILKLNGFDAVNEAGRKWCEGCGDNTCSLVVVSAYKVDEAIKKYNGGAPK